MLCGGDGDGGGSMQKQMGGGALSISGGLVVTTKITTHKTNDIALTMAAAAAPYDHLPTELRPR